MARPAARGVSVFASLVSQVFEVRPSTQTIDCEQHTGEAARRV